MLGKGILSSSVKFVALSLRHTHVTSSDTTTLPGRVLLQCVIYYIVVQERQVIIESNWSTAGAGGRVLVQLFVMCEVVENFVVVGLRLHAGAAAVAEDQFLLSLVTQAQVRHI